MTTCKHAGFRAANTREGASQAARITGKTVVPKDSLFNAIAPVCEFNLIRCDETVQVVTDGLLVSQGDGPGSIKKHSHLPHTLSRPSSLSCQLF